MLFDTIENLLDTLKMPYFFKHREFSSNKENLYIVYDFYDVPNLSGSGTEQVTEYTVTITVCGVMDGKVQNMTDRVEKITAELTDLFTQNGFVRGGASFTDVNGDEFPSIFYKVVDFKFYEEVKT